MHYLRKPISLISQSDVRYRGILAGIDPVASTIQLSNGESSSPSTSRRALLTVFEFTLWGRSHEGEHSVLDYVLKDEAITDVN